MRPSQIRPDADRDTYVAAIATADQLVEAASLTENGTLMSAAFVARREAWLALEDFDSRGAS